MKAIAEQINWRVMSTVGAVVLVCVVASYGFLDGETQKFVIGLLLGTGAGATIPATRPTTPPA